MKKIYLFCFFTLVFSLSGIGQVQWIRDFETAQKISISTNKPMLVEFWAIWCKPCKMMDDEVWNDEEMAEVMQNFVPVKVNLDVSHELAKKFQVNAIPYYFITDAQGNIFDKSLGYSGKGKVKYNLEKYSMNLEYMQRSMFQYYKKTNYITALRLASKYMDYSLLVDKGIRFDILNLSNHYLSEAENLLDKKQSNYEIMKQKIELLEMTIDLYREKFGRVERYLSKKIEDEDLKKYNGPLYAFLNYCISCNSHNSSEEDRWKTELHNYSNGDLYLSRAEKLLSLDH